MNRNLRMPAEWENPKAVLLTYPSPDTDWAYIYPEACRQFDSLLGALKAAGENVILIGSEECPAPAEVSASVPFNDTWTRDYGPITVEEDGLLRELDFGFNGWGLKFAADKDNLVNLHLSQKGVLDPSRYVNCRDFVLEGGSIESDGRGTILTTSRCLCSPNRNGGKSKAEIEVILRERLGAEKVLWLDYGFLAGDDTDSHIDTLARMAPGDTILYVSAPDDTTDIHYRELKAMEAQLREFGKKFVALPFPDPIFDEEGNRLPATYANYLVTARNLFIPTYGQPHNDEKAVRQISSAFPLHKVYTVDCLTLIKQHGSLHCSTMQLY